jgi:hypothetical protein
MKNFRINRQPIHQILLNSLIEIKKVMGGLFLEVVSSPLHCIGVAENKGQRNLSYCLNESETEQ